MHGFQRPVQAIRRGWYDHEMHVVGHQAIRDDLDRVARGGFAQEAQVLVSIGVLEEHVAPVIPSLRDVVRDAWEYEAGLPRHGIKLGDAASSGTPQNPPLA
jgi:hypothetical protein